MKSLFLPLWTELSPKYLEKTNLSIIYCKKKEKNNQSLHYRNKKGIPNLVVKFANHGHSDGIPLSLPECSDRFY